MADAVSSDSAEARGSLLTGLDAKIINLLPTGVCVCEAPSGRVVRYNRRAAEIWGREPGSEELYCGAYKLYSLDGELLNSNPMRQVLEQGQPVTDSELVVGRPDGSRIAIKASIEAIRDADGRTVGAISILQDISQHKTLEAEPKRLLKEMDAERERLLQAFERSPAFMAVLRGPDHVFERANRHYYAVVGKTDLLGLPVRDALPEIDGQGFLEQLDLVYKTAEPYVGRGVPIALQQDPDGALEERRVDFVYEPLLDSYGAVSGVLVHGIDLTEHLRVEENLAWLTAESERWRRLYETVLSATPDLVYVFDLDYRFTYANQALLAMWGQTWEQAIGKTCAQLGYPDWHAAMHEREIDQVVATQKPIRGEVPFAGTNGERTYDYIFVPVFGANGEVEAVAGTTRDVTERKHMEEELQRRAQELSASDRRKDEFIAMLAHELRNPLAPLRNGLQVLELAGDDPDASARVRDMMSRQLGHMVRLIDDLLDVSRINRNKLNLQKTPVLLEEVLANAVETSRPAIEAAGHQLTVTAPSEPILLHADLTRLAQIFSNLLSNSTKYMERGGHIWLSAEQHGGEISVAVRDTGMGIPADELERVFDMFSQVEQRSDLASGGLGIGLALVKNLVEMHGGSIRAASGGIGLGSTFTVKLPTVAAGAAVQAPTPTRPVQTRPVPHRVLVVDDNGDACTSMAMMLEVLGHTVETAHDGLEAVHKAQQCRPDLILMDVGMPNLNGYDATRRIRQQRGGQDISIYALTGWGQEADRSRSRSAGCDGHLVKPVSLGDLEDLLATLDRKEQAAAPTIAQRSSV